MAKNPTTNLIADRRLWLTADRNKVVEEGDPNAATLYATPGTVIPAEAVKRFKIKPLKKAKVKAEDKSSDPDQNKSGLTIVSEAGRTAERDTGAAPDAGPDAGTQEGK